MTAAVLVAVVTVLPLAVVAADGFGSSPAGALEYLIRPRTAELLTNTLLLLLVTVLVVLLWRRASPDRHERIAPSAAAA